MPTALDDLVRLDLVRPEFGPSGSAFVFNTTTRRPLRNAPGPSGADSSIGEPPDVLEALESAPSVNCHPPPRRGRTCGAVDCRLRAARATMRVSALVEAREHLDIADALHAEVPMARDDVAVVELHLLRDRSGSPGNFTWCG